MYKFTNSGDQTEILLYSLIEGGYTVSRLIKDLKELPQDSAITLRINSDGGEIFDAIAMYNYLKDRDVHVIIDGICASAASIVAMSGKRITMKQGSMFMIHNPITFAYGESEYLRAQADILDKITESIISIYQTKTNREHDEILALMKAESWMTENEALGYGFVDEIDTQPGPEPSAQAAAAMTYEDGVKAERQRMFALDELYTPERAIIINEAKYRTGKTADQIAVSILKAEAVRPPVHTVNNFSAKNESADIDAFIDAVKRKKGR